MICPVGIFSIYHFVVSTAKHNASFSRVKFFLQDFLCIPCIPGESGKGGPLHWLDCRISRDGRRNSSVDTKEFSHIRRQLGKTQAQMAQLLGTSLKAIQSFEQGWRRVPVHIERQVLFLLAMRKTHDREHEPCWVIERCPGETRRKCPAWEFQSGRLCWFINGTICHGEVQGSWREKMETCRKCMVFRSIFPAL
jgi:DNA-binding XRE family transcriptional regulator